MLEIEKISYQGEIIAIILPVLYSPEGIQFVTDPDNSLQLAVMRHREGHKIRPHVHRVTSRTVQYTQETLVVRRGCVRVNLYSSDMQYVCSRVLASGDVILLIKGGHGFEVLEDLEMIEIKQGPFLGERDKIHFDVDEGESDV